MSEIIVPPQSIEYGKDKAKVPIRLTESGLNSYSTHQFVRTICILDTTNKMPGGFMTAQVTTKPI